MKVAVDVGDPETWELRQSRWFGERFRRNEVRTTRAIETPRGHGKLVVITRVYIFDRKRKWKPRKSSGGRFGSKVAV